MVTLSLLGINEKIQDSLYILVSSFKILIFKCSLYLFTIKRMIKIVLSHMYHIYSKKFIIIRVLII